MCLGAITGNILVIVIIAVTKNFHSVTSVFLVNLAVSDCLVGLGVMPFVAMSIFYKDWNKYNEMTWIMHMLQDWRRNRLHSNATGTFLPAVLTRFIAKHILPLPAAAVPHQPSLVICVISCSS
eukprot:gi/632961109/ref/XP_007896575.1/ PREDICTED: neuropeptide FF receptor 2-like [Callorhinchus milii]